MNILSIGGSDPSAGAGIQSDIRDFSKLNVHCLTVITGITSQNTSKFGKVQPVSKENLKNQLESVFSDFEIDAIKIGMVYNSEIIKILYNSLKKIKIPIIIDPVIKSTTGGTLLKKSAIKDFQKFLIPLSTAITPNKFEAEIITKTKINSKNPPQKIAQIIQSLGAKNVIITGIETKQNEISDYVLGTSAYKISNKKINKINHGSGGNYSAALTFAIAKRKNIQQAANFAKNFTLHSIKNAKKQGKGISITGVSDNDKTISDLQNAVIKFTEIRKIVKKIPECQTNFVNSKPKSKSIKDILGISGRIVKAGNNVIVAGDFQYGGSKHVATALFVAKKKFPELNSAVNIKFQEDTIKKIKKLKMTVSNYDREQEPKNVKIKGSSIEWGIKTAIKKSLKTPDVIFHKGDFGKEPMIIVFGKSPNDVIKKLQKL